MQLKGYGQSFIKAVLIVYFLGAMIAAVLLMVLSRWQCIEDKGFLGIFWCDVLGTIYSSFFRALLWPYFLYQWLLS